MGIGAKVNAEDLSLVVIIVGTRGSGKTLLMSHFEIEALSRAWAVMRAREIANNPELYPRKKTNVFSNYPVKGLWRPPDYAKPITLESEPLEMDKLVRWHPDFANGYIFFDEIDQVADRQDWMSTVAKLLTAGVQVLRHRNLTLVASIQSLNWLNARLQWQADVIIKCRDLSFTPWGRERGIAPGEIASTSWIDKSGILTGYSFEENGAVYPLRFFGKRYWGAYSTVHEFDILEYKRKYKLNLDTKVITERDNRADINEQRLRETLEYFLYNNPGERVLTRDFWDMARSLGYTGDAKPIGGQYIKALGVKQSGAGNYSRYDLSGVTLPEVEETAEV